MISFNEAVDTINPTNARGTVRRIDTSAVVVDCLSNAMAADDLRRALERSCIDTTAAHVSFAESIQNSKTRKTKKDAGASLGPRSRAVYSLCTGTHLKPSERALVG